MIRVNKNQRGNNLLDYLKIPYSFTEEITTDYEVKNFISILFVSIKYHSINPEYLIMRNNSLKNYKIKILLILIDIPNYQDFLKDFIIFDFQIFYCLNNFEASKFISFFYKNANLSSDNLKQKYSLDKLERKKEFFKKFPKINKNDLKNLELENKSIFEIVKEEKKYFLKNGIIKNFLEMEFKKE